MTTLRLALIALASSSGLGPTATAQVAPPMIRASKPLGVAPGGSVTLEVKLSEARDGATLRFDDPRVRVEGPAELGKADGNGQRTLKARVVVPEGIGPGPIGFRVVTDGGVSNPGHLLPGRPIPPVAEAEPNDRLR